MDTEVSNQLLGACLIAAGAGAGPGATEQEVIAGTWRLYRILSHPTATVDVTMTVARNGVRSQFYEFRNITEESVMTAMTMDDTATVVVATEDDHGDATPDQLTWTGSDGGANLTLSVSADTKTCTVTPVAEGTGITVTAADASAPSAASFVAEFDVGPGPTSQLVGTVTVNTGANVTPPA